MIDTNGSTVDLPDTTPHKSENGVLYVLSTVEIAEQEAVKAAYELLADDRQKEVLRYQRKPLLEEADILIYKAEDTGASTTALRVYRQALRDVTAQIDIYNVTWPVKP